MFGERATLIVKRRSVVLLIINVKSATLKAIRKRCFLHMYRVKTGDADKRDGDGGELYEIVE